HKDGTLYSCLSGLAFDGPNKGKRLQPAPTLVSDWGFWLKYYPQAVAYHMFDKYRPVEFATAPNEDSLKSRGPADERLAADTPVLGVIDEEEVRAYPLDKLEKVGLIEEEVAGQRRVVLWEGSTRTAAAYRAVANPPEKMKAPSRHVTLRLEGNREAATFVDKETGSRWDIAGRATVGTLKGWTLSWLDGTQAKWFAWAGEYPHTTIYGR